MPRHRTTFRLRAMYSNLRRSLINHWKFCMICGRTCGSLVESECLELTLYLPKLRAEELESHVPSSTAPSQGREIFGYGPWPPETRCLIQRTCPGNKRSSSSCWPIYIIGTSNSFPSSIFWIRFFALIFHFCNCRCQGTHCCCMCCEQGPASTKSIGTLSEEQTTQKL